MKREKPKKSKAHKLFDPDEIATLISQAVLCDLGSTTQEYGGPNNPLAYAKYRQSSEILNKYCSPSQDKDRLVAETFAKFREVNDHMGQVNEKLEKSLPWNLVRIQSTVPMMDKIHHRARVLMREVLTTFDEDEWFSEVRHSGGSTVGVPYRDTSVEAKFTFPMSTTEGCVLMLDRYRMFDSHMNIAISEWNRERPVEGPVRIAKGSHATTVDKTTDKRRFIAKEPTLNMFFQQGLMQMMYKRMVAFDLDVRSLPDRNRTLAYESSITGLNSTIDWSSASDCVSTVLLRYLLPRKWYDAVMRTRSHETLIEGEWVNLNMISTMGNACTFPLETLVFWTYAHAVHQTLTTTGNTSFSWPRNKEISVFGDDCIVPDWMAPQYVDAVQAIGFRVNQEKSCIGPDLRFRESCGADYLAGFDVRPFFLKAPSSDRLSALEPWLNIVVNRLLQKYILYFGRLTYVYEKRLWRVLSDLYTRFRFRPKLIPSFLPDDAGLKLGHDAPRFALTYGVKFDTITRDTHGSIAYRYCRFVYWNNPQRSEDIRLALWLKKPKQSKRIPIGQLSDTYLDREKGGYVVAKGLTSHWDVPDFGPVKRP